MATPTYWQKRYGFGWRGNKKDTPRIRDSRRVDEYFSATPKDFAAYILNLAEGLDDPRVEWNVEYTAYDRDRDFLEVVGWRDATPEEITAKEAEISQSAAKGNEWTDRMEKQLRALRPEIFKD